MPGSAAGCHPQRRIRVGVANITSLSAGAEGHLLHSPFDILLLQEHRQSVQGALLAKRRFARHGWCSSFDAGVPKVSGISGGTAVLIRQHLCPQILPAPAAGRLSAMVLPLRGMRVLVVSIYGHTGEGVQGNNLALWGAVVALAAEQALPIVLAGDFNCTPAELLSSGVLAQLGASVLPFGTDITHTCVSPGREGGRGRILDYIVVSNGLLSAFERAEASFDVPWSPHAFISAEFCANPGSLQLVRISRPRAFPPIIGNSLDWNSALAMAAGLLSGRGFLVIWISRRAFVPGFLRWPGGHGCHDSALIGCGGSQAGVAHVPGQGAFSHQPSCIRQRHCR